MRDYGKVHTSFWASSTITSLSEDGRLLALYLLTCPHGNLIGAFRLSDGYICDDIGWPSERVSKGFGELFQKGFANRCGTTKWVLLNAHLKWNPLENPNQRKAALKIANQIPDNCAWKLDFMRVCGHLFGAEPPPPANPSETVPEPFRNQEQEQYQEQEQSTSTGSRANAGTRTRAERFALPESWEPSPEFPAALLRAGIDPERFLTAANLAEFVSYRRAEDATTRTQAQWEHRFLQTLIAIRDRTGGTRHVQSTQNRTGNPQRLSAFERMQHANPSSSAGAAPGQIIDAEPGGAD